MNAVRIIRRSVVLGLAVGFIAAVAGPVDAQIFRRPGRPAQPGPAAQPPRGAFSGGLFRDNSARENAARGNTFSGGTVQGGTVQGGTAPGRGVPLQAPGPQPEIFIVVPLDAKPFRIEQTDYVRLSAQGMPGCEFATKIEGPARVHRKIYAAAAEEGKYSVAAEEAEFEFAMTGVGKVKIDIIVTVPNAPAPTVTTYQFEVVPSEN